MFFKKLIFSASVTCESDASTDVIDDRKNVEIKNKAIITVEKLLNFVFFIKFSPLKGILSYFIQS